MTERILSTGGFMPNWTVMSAPPVKSMPYFKLPFRDPARETGRGQRQREADEEPLLAEKIDVCLSKQFHGLQP